MRLNSPSRHTFGGHLAASFPGRPPSWQGPLVEVDRLQTHDPSQVLDLLDALELDRLPSSRTERAVGLLLGAQACAALGGVPGPGASPVPVPECVAVVVERGRPAPSPFPEPASVGASVGEWTGSWSDAEHAAAVERVRTAIARGDCYQGNVVGHRSAPYEGDPVSLAGAVAGLPGAVYGGVVVGEGWAVGSASPEQLVRVEGDRVTTVPVKGTSHDPAQLLASAKDRAEHVMIVDLERNDLGRVCDAGSVVVEQLFALSEWAGLWHAGSRVAGRLRRDARTVDVLRALLPGGSVTGAPKHAACGLLAELEPVGRGPAMGALGFVHPGGLDLGLTIRTVAAGAGRVHLWAGGGVTWGSDPDEEVAEAHAKATPVLRALDQVRPSAS